MALYIPAGKRRRRLVLMIAVGVVIGLAVGLIVGRTTAPDLHSGVNAARDKAQVVVDSLHSLPLEYAATQQGQAGKSTATFDHSLDVLDTKLEAAVGKAEWLGPAARQRLHAALTAVRTAADRNVPVTQFQTVITSASNEVTDEFSLKNG